MQNQELRKLAADSLFKIAEILETNKDWIKVMEKIPKDVQCDYTPGYERKYSSEHVRLIEEHSKATGRKCAAILLEEWSTSGKIRPTLKTLKELVIQAEIYRAADEIAAMLKETPPPRPEIGPAAVIDTNVTEILAQMQSTKVIGDVVMTESADRSNNYTTHQMQSDYNVTSGDIPNLAELNSVCNQSTEKLKSKSHLITISDNVPTPQIVSSIEIDSNDIPNFSLLMKSEKEEKGHKESTGSEVETSILQDVSLIHFEYEHLKKITYDFSKCIGRGGFGEVFLAFHPKYGPLAVKGARSNLGHLADCKPDISTDLFNTEVKSLSQLRHKNIVPILGFSKDGPTMYIVCEYIDGGSLEQTLAKKILTEIQRIHIMIGTAEGLKYLHNLNFMHRDVKTANILLTKDFTPKLCDFGLAKQQYDQTVFTNFPMGTSAYMAPEGQGGTVTKKIDIYSFGIVLLELLTGLKVHFVYNSEQYNIKEYVNEKCKNNDIHTLLDSVADWTKSKEIFKLANHCIALDRNERPTINEVCDTLNNLLPN